MTEIERLNLLVAEHLMGWTDIRQNESGQWVGVHPTMKQRLPLEPFSYSQYRDMFANNVEPEIARRGLIPQYLNQLVTLVDGGETPMFEDDGGLIDELSNFTTASELWAVLTAPLDIRCKAALRACGVEVG